MSALQKIPQVKDDPELLELMMNDLKNSNELYRPTNYWEYFEKRTLPELKAKGLHDFRRRRSEILTRLGATDLIPGSLSKLKFFITKIFYKANILLPSDYNYLYYLMAKLYGTTIGAKSITEFEGSLVGNPENVIEIEGKRYTPSLIECYFHYAYCCRFINFSSINTIAELGSGACKQIEVIKKLHPHITFFVFDIPPQIYICEQYLSEIFPNDVISYRQTREMKKIPDNIEGKILFFGNWKISELENLKYDLFWNSASFQEMEPNVVLNYLNYVNQQTNAYVYLNEAMKGKNIAKKPGEIGVKEQTKLEHYKRGLQIFNLEDISPNCFLYGPNPAYSVSFWRKKK